MVKLELKNVCITAGSLTVLYGNPISKMEAHLQSLWKVNLKRQGQQKGHWAL